MQLHLKLILKKVGVSAYFGEPIVDWHPGRTLCRNVWFALYEYLHPTLLKQHIHFRGTSAGAQLSRAQFDVGNSGFQVGKFSMVVRSIELLKVMVQP